MAKNARKYLHEINIMFLEIELMQKHLRNVHRKY